jgi:hypothetical protein
VYLEKCNDALSIWATAGKMPTVCMLRLQVLDTDGNLWYIPVGELPKNGTTTPPKTPDPSRQCTPRMLYRFSRTYSGYTGLSSAFRSDVSTARHTGC